MANPKNGDSVFVVIKNGAIQSIHASSESANAAIVEGSDIAIHKVVGGSVNIDAVEKKPQVKTDDAEKKKTKTSAAKSEPPAKKTNTPAEQRAANFDKPKRGQVEENTLPANVKKLLDGTGGTLSGMAICVTGVPPVMGRKNAEKLVEAYGGKLTKSLSKNAWLSLVMMPAQRSKPFLSLLVPLLIGICKGWSRWRISRSRLSMRMNSLL